MLDKRWISTKEAASRNGCTDGYIRRLARDEKIACHQVNERFWLVDAKSVEQYFAQPRPVGRPISGGKKNSRKSN